MDSDRKMDLGYVAWRVREAVLVQLEGNLVNRFIDIAEFSAGGQYIGYATEMMQGIFFTDDYDGCYERPEYYLLKRYKRGMSFNCFKVRHYDMNKELYNPDDKRTKTFTAVLRKWIRENNIKVPPIMLASDHLFFAPAVRDTMTGVFYLMNPELNGASKSEFTTEDASEYHRANINRYPDKKKYMEEWVKLAAQRHKVFEKNVEAKERHKLDLSEYGAAEPIEEIKTTSSDLNKEPTQTNGSNNITQQLIDLNKLYKSGALTEEEFTKAKSKLLK